MPGDEPAHAVADQVYRFAAYLRQYFSRGLPPLPEVVPDSTLSTFCLMQYRRPGVWG